jgi:hypothetical protein
MSNGQQKSLEFIAKMSRGESAFPMSIAIEEVSDGTLQPLYEAVAKARKQLDDSMWNIAKEMGVRIRRSQHKFEIT